MNNKQPVVDNPVNASPRANHRRQMMLQVWLPLGIALLIVLGLVIITVAGAAAGSMEVFRWGNISTIFLLIPVILILALFAVVTIASVYGMTKLLRNMPGWMLMLQLRMVHISLVFRRLADSATQPFIAANMQSARAKRLWDRFIRRKTQSI